MRYFKHPLILNIFCSLVFFSNCGDDSDDPAPAILGCMDQTSINYNSLATEDNGSCQYEGCTDPLSLSYDVKATIDDGTCLYIMAGEWEVSSYLLGGVQVMNSYEYLYFDLFGDNTYNVWGETIDGDFYDVYGVWQTTNDFTVLQLIGDTGTTENWDIIDISAIYLEISQTIEGVFYSIELDRI